MSVPCNGVIAFYPQTWSCRRFRSREDLLQWYGQKGEKPTKYWFKSAEDLAKVYTSEQLAKIIEGIRTAKLTHGRQVTHDIRDNVDRVTLDDIGDADISDHLDLAKTVWWLFHQLSDLVEFNLKIMAATQSDCYLIHLDRMLDESSRTIIAKFPKQLRLIVDELVKQNCLRLFKDDLSKLLNAMVNRGVLKTKQDPMRVFNLYQGLLAEYKFIEYKQRDGERKTDPLRYAPKLKEMENKA